MSSVTKALDLLSLFSPARPEIGLSQLCRLAKRDKATTYRHLQALEDACFVEQNPVSKHYRLGPAVLQLAQTREATVPRKAGAEAALRALASATGETTHVSVLSGQTLCALYSVESSKHSTRVIIDIQTFPLHATASGICALAFGPDALRAEALNDLHSYTRRTVTTPEQLDAAIAQARRMGFGKTVESFESEVSSLAAPIFDQSGGFTGAVSVASVATRFTPALEETIKTHLMAASRQITHNWGGSLPPEIEQAWDGHCSRSSRLETAP